MTNTELPIAGDLATRGHDETAGPLSFCGLPPEIRNHIYALVLTRQDHVKFFAASTTTVLELRVFTSDFETDEVVGDDSFAIAILRANRQLHAEATPLLYGANTFSFCRKTDVLHKFIKQIGSSKRHLRHLEIDEISNVSTMRSALNLLKTSTSMRTFKIAHETMRPSGQEQNRVKLFVPWLKAMKKAYQARGDDFDVTKVLCIGGLDFDRSIFGGLMSEEEYDAEVAEIRRLNDEMYEELKAALA